MNVKGDISGSNTNSCRTSHVLQQKTNPIGLSQPKVLLNSIAKWIPNPKVPEKWNYTHTQMGLGPLSFQKLQESQQELDHTGR